MPTGKYKRSEENNRKMSARLKGRTFTDQHREKLRLAGLGKKHTEATRAKLREIRKGTQAGEKNHFFGRSHSPETGKKVSGENHYNWQGGRTAENKRMRKSPEYRLWREAVFARDNHTCRFCGKRGGELHADHIKPFAYFPELRFAIDNGRTLCVPCHKSTPTYGAKI